MRLGARILKLRTQADQSLQDVADAVGVSKAHIWEIEKGRADNPSMALVGRLAEHFQVSVAYLVGEDIKAEDADPELQYMFRQAQKLNANERAILKDMVDSLVKRGRRAK